jgi:hypothetical protein
MAISTSQFRRKAEAGCCLDRGTAICKARVSERAQTAARVERHNGSEGRMTTSFDKREEGFEKKFAHDEELRFKAYARRNKLLGLWAAEMLGKSGAEAEAYAKEVVLADFEEPGENDVLHKVVKDLEGKASEQQIRTQMTALLAQAVEQISKSG